MANYIVKNNNIIEMTRGDYLKFQVDLSNREFPLNETYSLEDGDLLFFALMEPHQPFEEALIKKEISHNSEGELWVKLYPEDTIDLIPGTYYYQIKILYKLDDDSDAHIETVVQKTKFMIVD